MSAKTPTDGDANLHASPRERMAKLERRATVIRSRLLRAVDALDARRHQVERIGEHAKEIALPAVVVGAGVVVLFGASVAAFKLALRARRRRSLGYRVREAIRGLDLVPRPSLTRKIVEKIALSLVTLAVTELGKRAIGNVVDGRLLNGRQAVGDGLAAHHRVLVGPEGAGV